MISFLIAGELSLLPISIGHYYRSHTLFLFLGIVIVRECLKLGYMHVTNSLDWITLS